MTNIKAGEWFMVGVGKIHVAVLNEAGEVVRTSELLPVEISGVPGVTLNRVSPMPTEDDSFERSEMKSVTLSFPQQTWGQHITLLDMLGIRYVLLLKRRLAWATILLALGRVDLALALRPYWLEMNI